MSETKLLPCPFCGGELRRNMQGAYEDDNRDCILYGFEIHEKMIPMWNTRKPMERIVERLEEYNNENSHEENSGFIDVCIDIVKEGLE